MKRAFSKHSLLSLDWAVRGRITGLDWAEENLKSGLSGTRTPNSRTIALSFCWKKIMLCKHVRRELLLTELEESRDTSRSQFCVEFNARGETPVQMRASRTVSYTGRSVDRCSHRPVGLMSEPDSLWQEHGYRFWELFLIRRLSDQFPGPVQPQHFICWRRFLPQSVFSQTAEKSTERSQKFKLKI